MSTVPCMCEQLLAPSALSNPAQEPRRGLPISRNDPQRNQIAQEEGADQLRVFCTRAMLKTEAALDH